MAAKLKAALLGASGYTGADLLRLGLRHPNLDFVALSANSHAGKPIGAVFPHLAGFGLPDLVTAEEVSAKGLDVMFCGLPHATSQKLVAAMVAESTTLRVIDMGADFRFRDPAVYAATYKSEHVAPKLQMVTAYGLTEHNRKQIAQARIIACPGCYPTATLLALIPLVKSGAILGEDIIVDAKSGVSGAGRGLKLGSLFSEMGESLAPYSVGNHRHAPEIEQELTRFAGSPITVNFTPHLIPMSRGELVTCHVKLGKAKSAADLRKALARSYADEPFIRIAPEDEMPSTGAVRGSNYCLINVFADRIPGRAIVIAAIDNLVKGSAGQAIQNFNVAFGFPETTALDQLALFP